MDKPKKDNRGLIIPKTIIFSLKILDFISPYLCMRFAGYLWTKPLKYKIPEREIPVIKLAKKLNFTGGKERDRKFYWYMVGVEEQPVCTL